MHAPRMPHRIRRYIKGTPQIGILITPTNSFQLTGYSDTDWLGVSTLVDLQVDL